MAKVGRPTDALKHRFKRILEEANAYEKFKSIMVNSKNPETFIRTFEIAHDRAYGKAPQFVEMDVANVTPRPSIDELLEAKALAEKSLGYHSNGDNVEGGK